MMTHATETTTTETETTPLRDAYLAAHAAAVAAEDAWTDDETCAEDDLAHPARIATDVADAARDAARAAWLSSDEPREYEFRVDDGFEFVASRPSEVKDQLEGWITTGDWDRSQTIWLDGYAWTLDPATDDRISYHADVRVEITLQPIEPRCRKDKTHDWAAPHAIVGGLKENPGVWGSGGGVKITEVCRHCGRQKCTDTWATNPSNGTQGHTSVSYEEPDEETLAWVASRRGDGTDGTRPAPLDGEED